MQTELRLQIDKFMNTIKFLQSSREVSLAATNLQRSFSWLGESLKSSGSPSPYVSSDNPSVATIEKRADHNPDDILDGWDSIEHNQVSRVKFMRSVTQGLIDQFREKRKNSESAGKEYDQCLDQSFIALKEVKIWLGWELGRLRDLEINALSPDALTTAPKIL